MAPIVKTLPSYIKDSQHALEIFRDFSFLGQNKVILTMDITSLYTVIRNGLQALKHFFDHRTVKEPSSETLLRLAELVLTSNRFSFGGNYYKQTNGVVMGTQMGPSYANLFVGFIKRRFFSQYHIHHTSRTPYLYHNFSDFVVYVATLIFSKKQRQCASFSINVAILFLSFKRGTTGPNNLIDSQHYKRLRRNTLTEFHSLLHFTLTTSRLHLSFLKTLNYSKMTQRLALSFRNSYLFHSNVTKT